MRTITVLSRDLRRVEWNEDNQSPSAKNDYLDVN